VGARCGTRRLAVRCGEPLLACQAAAPRGRQPSQLLNATSVKEAFGHNTFTNFQFEQACRPWGKPCRRGNMPEGFQTVPDWFSWENQGADITIADLSGNGQRDLVVLMIDNPPQQNRGLYRVGKNLDANGNVAQWTPWIEIPDWFSSENQGGGVAVTPPDTQG